MKTEDKAKYDGAGAEPKRYRTFEDLEVYRFAREFRKSMYEVNRGLPSFEKFELGSQIRRAAVSLTNNITEGHGRFHYLEQIKFCLNARGSLEELPDDLNVCADESYLAGSEIDSLKVRGWCVHRLLNGYMRWLRERKQRSALSCAKILRLTDGTDDQLDELFDGMIEPPRLRDGSEVEELKG